jgi:prolyl 4-hydroxylase
LKSVRVPGPNYTSSLIEPIFANSVPFLYSLHSFLSPQQCSDLIDFCTNQREFEPSPVGVEGLRGSSTRNSTSCTLHPNEASLEMQHLLQSITNRAAWIAGVPSDNVERLQMVRYVPTQWYHAHHDWFDHPDYFPNNRYVTMLVYLNDDFVGGHTSFPRLNVSVAPKIGSAAFWYNCWSRPGTNDTTCFDENLHQGNPPTSGVKYALNIWISMYPDWEADRAHPPLRNKKSTRGVGKMLAAHTKTPGTSEIDIEAGEEVWLYTASKNHWGEVLAPNLKKV